MELKVKKITFPEIIEFNFEELKAEITERTASYLNLVYTEEQIKDAKKDVALLRKFTKALSDERIRVKKECLKPYEDFEKKVKELSGIVEKSIDNIDGQVKEFEEQTKAKKHHEIVCFFDSCNHPEWLTLEMIFDEKWLNASAKIKAIAEEILSIIEKIENDITTLSNLPEFGFESVEVYKNTLDMNRAIQEGKRLAEIQQRKAAEEAAKAEAAAATVPEPAKVQPEQPEQPEQQKQWVSFAALLSAEDAKALRELFVSRNIQYKAI